MFQENSIPDTTTPQCGPVFLPRGAIHDSEGLISPDLCMVENSKSPLDTDSPDSGHREMSSDSLALALHEAEFPFWAMSEEERIKYSFGFGSPVKFRQMSYEMTAVSIATRLPPARTIYVTRNIIMASISKTKKIIQAKFRRSQNYARPLSSEATVHIETQRFRTILAIRLIRTQIPSKTVL
ncbi:hypothetical protein DPMN_154709 [Dreissena polymorpha]|uniref:Uncharacterized protein n=1 Tax=Dreissena polymorpha TaxID=45954 RepID=A0A9D4J783_DREPO|nr:hypothetical protein DPMN_154709 [Dreissena polymorpha]